MTTFTTKAYGATGTPLIGKSLEPMEVERQRPGPEDVLIEVLYCGMCHSDIHQVANDWKNTIYPCVPGHEVIGKVTEIGSSVTKFKVGEVVGVGCMIDSCGQCSPCHEGEEQYCGGPVGPTMTYNGHLKPDGSGFNTFGGYSTHVVAKEAFVLKIPEGLDHAAAAPILCAGVTTYSPLKRWLAGPGEQVAIVGIGGLGHMGVMIAKALGASVTAITTKEEKRRAAEELGAGRVLISTDKEAMKAAEGSFDIILVTIPESFDVNDYIPLLKTHGTLVTVGLLGPYKAPLNNMIMAQQGRSVAGSMIGGVEETQEVLEFCAKHGILPQIKLVGIEEVNEAFEKIKDEEVRFRYVIDMATLKEG